MIKVFTGYAGPGGSTIALSTLVNLFNEAGLESCLYTEPGLFDSSLCKNKKFSEATLSKNDSVIFHFMTSAPKGCRIAVLSCHETELFKVSSFKDLGHDKVHFVSQFQKEWQGIEGTVIPNPIRKFNKVKKNLKVVGIIGSIDSNKRVHESIIRAKKDGFSSVRIYGQISDFKYFAEKVVPLIKDGVTYNGVASNMDSVYAELSHVYHSPLLETYNLIKPECEAAGVVYIGNEGNDTKAEVWTNEKILSSWKNLLSI